jgi:hypothetical protein
MGIRAFRQRVGGALLSTGTELAYEQKAFERAMATAGASGSSAHVAVELARRACSAVLWLGMRIHPSTIAGVV